MSSKPPTRSQYIEREPTLPLAGDGKSNDRLQLEEGGVQLEVDWEKATANYDYIFIPGRKPIQRRHRNIWTDMDEAEFQKQSKFLQHLNLLKPMDALKLWTQLSKRS